MTDGSSEDSLEETRTTSSDGQDTVIDNVPTKVAVGLVGPGLVGGELLKQLETTRSNLEKSGVDVSINAIFNIRSGKPWMLLQEEKYITIADYETAFADEVQGQTGELDKMADFLKSLAPHAVIFDTTAAEPVSNMYEAWLKRGVHVITPNKKVGSGPLARYKACLASAATTQAKWGRECTVGAGLPILHILRTDLLRTGDEIKKIEGIFSGTLSYLFNTFKPGMNFSDVVEDARSKGFTEPDPRDDLNGVDVQRKVVILARECGLDVELEDVPVESLVPKALQDWQPAQREGLATAFIQELKAFDSEKEALIAEAEAAGEVLRFVGTVDIEAKQCSVRLARFPKTHAFASTQWADNIVTFDTARYTPKPLVVQGPGAGAAVTAAGLYADFLRITDGLQ